MWKELQELVDKLGMSTGELLLIAGEITGNRNMRTTDLMTKAERRILIGELENQLRKHQSAVMIGS